jgi:hypothetical protein
MTVATREKRLLERYGELLTAADLAEVFRYSSDAAVRKAHAAGRLPVRLRKFPNRRGLFATARSVAVAITQIDDESEA